MEHTQPISIAPPNPPEKLLSALGQKLAPCAELIGHASLVLATYADGHEEHLLGFVNVNPSHEAALAHTVNEAIIFCGLENWSLSVAFFKTTDDIVAVFQKVGLSLTLKTQPQTPPRRPQIPGSDPSKPPILR